MIQKLTGDEMNGSAGYDILSAVSPNEEGLETTLCKALGGNALSLSLDVFILCRL